MHVIGRSSFPGAGVSPRAIAAKRKGPLAGSRGANLEVGYSAFSLAAGIFDCVPPWPVVVGGTLCWTPGADAVVVLSWFENANMAMPPINITATAMPAQAAVLMPSSLVS